MDNKNGNKKLKLGIFVVVGALFFMGMVYYIGSNQNLFSKTFMVSGMFNNVSGLQEGNNVRLSGINVGKIETIEIVNDSTVRVDMMIEEENRQFIKKDSRVTIGSEGLMGNKVIMIMAGKREEVVVDNDMLKTVKAVEMDDIIKSLKTTTDNAALITGDLTQLVGKINDGKGPIGALLADTVLALSLTNTMRNIEKTTNQLTADIQTLHPVFSNAASITAKANEITTKANEISNNAIRVTDDMAKVTKRINAGEGVVGTLLMDTTFASNLSKTMGNVEKATNALNEDLRALQNNFLFKGYFKKKEKEKRKEMERKQQEEEIKLKDLQHKQEEIKQEMEIPSQKEIDDKQKEKIGVKKEIGELHK